MQIQWKATAIGAALLLVGIVLLFVSVLSGALNSTSPPASQAQAASGAASGAVGTAATPVGTPAGAPGAATPAATAPPQLAPQQAPSGWVTYRGPHFAIAYPANLVVDTFPKGGAAQLTPVVNYIFHSADYRVDVTVTENDNLDAGSLAQICATSAQLPSVSFAGLQLRYDDTGSYGVVRSWLFVTDKATVYELLANDDHTLTTQDEGARAAIKAQNAAILATFQAEYTTGGCK